MPYSQNERIYSVFSPLGEDALLLRSLEGVETLGHPFRFELELASERSDIDFKAVIGAGLTVRIALQDAPPRYVHGIVSRFVQGAASERFVSYRAEIVPWLWLLSRGSSCRIFQELSVIDILEKIFAERGFTDFEDKTQRTYAPIGYCVQYRESDFDFVSRLMEENGIGYYFVHDEKRHVLVLFDGPGGNPESPQVAATCTGATSLLRMGNVWGWSSERALGPGACSLTDYDFEKPNSSLTVSTSTADPVGGNEAFEIYDHPGRYTSVEQGEALARLRMEAEEAAAASSTAASDCALFCPGTHFQLLGHYRPDCNALHLLTQVTHSGRQSLGGEEPAPSTYQNSFSCIPYTTPWRPLLRTPRPVIQGVQSAVVVGPPGEEIHVDPHARVKVQFHWDREGQRNENSSCWIRVSQLWAGKNWGGISIPRIGQEVIVEFVEGDPDRPIITGRVYNADQTPPFPLPAGASSSGLKSRSTPGGGGYNEISMDDTRGKEAVTIHAQYDMATTVEHDQALTVHNSRSSTIDVDDTESVGGSQTRSVGGSQTLTVEADRSVSVRGAETIAIDGAQGQTIGADRKLTIGGADTIEIAAAHQLRAGGDYSVATDAGLTTSSAADTEIASAANISVSASGTITLSAGGSTIEIGAGGIKIVSAAPVEVQGASIKLN